MSSIASQLQLVHARIERAAHAAGRQPEAIQLLAVSKFFDAQCVLEAVHAGQCAFGENYLQEALDKMAAVQAAAPGVQLSWHFIGPIQSNKTRLIAQHFDWVHTVDREKVACRLAEQRPPQLPPLNICLQVNISGEDSKSGLDPAHLLPLAQVVANLPGLRLRGLMAIPAATEVVAEQHAACARLRLLAQQLAAHGMACDTLSMGMSADLDAAIAEGATIVRVGSAIFGQRKRTQLQEASKL